MLPRTEPFWRAEIDSLAFRPIGHDGLCFVHRLAFRTILGVLPEPNECAAFFEAEHRAFQAAARAKIARRGLRPDANLHLTSRDVRREMEPDLRR
jgi:hypothetical protein